MAENRGCFGRMARRETGVFSAARVPHEVRRIERGDAVNRAGDAVNRAGDAGRL